MIYRDKINNHIMLRLSDKDGIGKFRDAGCKENGIVTMSMLDVEYIGPVESAPPYTGNITTGLLTALISEGVL